MEFVFLESAFVSFSVLEVLGTLAVEHPVVPVALVLAMSTLSVEHSPAGLDSISEIPFVPAAIRPPEGASSIAFSSLELSFINITLFPGPGIDSSSLFFVEFEFPHVVISSREV